jgi:hypothetical protein
MTEQRPADAGGAWQPTPGPAYPAQGPAYPGAGPAYPGAGPWAAGQYPPPVGPYPPPVPSTSHRWIWVLAGALGLMVAVALGVGALFLFSGPETYGDDPRLDALWDACDRGDMGACDRLFWDAPILSDYEDFGFTCGGRTDGAVTCAR